MNTSTRQYQDSLYLTRCLWCCSPVPSIISLDLTQSRPILLALATLKSSFFLANSRLHLERRHPVKGTSQTPHTYLSSRLEIVVSVGFTAGWGELTLRPLTLILMCLRHSLSMHPCNPLSQSHPISQLFPTYKVPSVAETTHGAPVAGVSDALDENLSLCAL